MLTDDVRNVFLRAKNKKTLIITVGNSFRKDDGVGPYIASLLDPTETPFVILDAGDKPENIVDEVGMLEPDITMIIDAADFGGAPGEIRIIDEENIPDATLTTHTFPLKVVTKLLKDDTGCEIIFIGIQPKDVGYGEGLTKHVQSSADELIDLIRAC
jgi:hydrogenase 3 maturation protease